MARQEQDIVTAEAAPTPAEGRPVILLGNANVGKSVLFGALTGRYVAVSNYPGTTVEVARGSIGLNGSAHPLFDTPGVQSLLASSDDERVTRDILLESDVEAVILVADAKNLVRGLMLAIEAGEAGLPIVLDLNMSDEADTRGIRIDRALLADYVGVPVVGTVALRGEGTEEIKASIPKARLPRLRPHYPEAVEAAVEEAARRLDLQGPSARNRALVALCTPESDDGAAVADIRERTDLALGAPVVGAVQRARLEAARTVAVAVTSRVARSQSVLERMGRWTVHPIVGWPILIAVLYLMYLFVGVLGASFLVDLLETRVFGEWLNPLLTGLVGQIPIPIVVDFLVGEYGAVTMALTYSLAIVLPIVFTFFLAFSVLEDSGYLPRLAVLLDRIFRWMGLNGKAVLPMILGLGCDTMATMTTRILETRKERIQVTLLLALGVPCSAQLGVILGMLAGLGTGAVMLWFGVIAGTMLAVGWIAARLLPGESSDFILEIPPMRAPSARNIVIKTAARVEWYLWEVVPVFLAGTAFLFVLDRLDLLAAIQRAMSPLIVSWLGLPGEVTDAFLVGFLRRDYGAAGLFAIARTGALDGIQITVSLIVVTLFMPCIANLLMIIKEYGARTAVMVTAVVFPLAFLIGGLVNMLLRALAA